MLLTVQEAAEQLRVHPVSLRRMIRRGDIAAVRVGRLWRVDEESLKPQRVEKPAKPEPVGFLRYVHLESPRPSGSMSPTRPRDTGAHSDLEAWSD